MRVLLSLRDSYADTFDNFTKAELTGNTYFLSPPPDLYLNRMKPEDAQHNEYLLDIPTNELPYLIRKRIDAYIEHYDNDDWIITARSVYPAILIVCSDAKIEDSMQRYIKKSLEDAGIDGELFYYTTTIKALLASDKHNNAIWSKELGEDGDTQSF